MNQLQTARDKQLGGLFFILTVLFIILAMTNQGFFDWAYERHQNQLSWYLRPLFIISFCYFAYKRSWTGIMGTMFITREFVYLAFHGLRGAYIRKIPVGGGPVLFDGFLYMRTLVMGIGT